jgi:hypothetical protein
MAKVSEVTAVTPQVEVSNVDTQKIVRISLTQENKAGKQNATFLFSSKGENLNDFLSDTAKKVVGVLEIQSRIQSNGGKANVFGLTKGGIFELGISVAIDGESTKVLNNFVFTLAQLGTVNPELVLIDYVEGFKLLTE